VTIISVAMSIVVIAAALLAVYRAHRSSAFGLGAILAVFVIEIVVEGIPPVNVGVNIFAQDVVAVVLVAASVLRILANTRNISGLASIFWLMFGVLIAFSLLRGFGPYGTNAVVESRPHWYYWSAALYFMTFRPTSANLRRLCLVWILVGGVLGLLVLFRWVSDALGLSDYSAVGAGIPLRVVNAQTACFIAFSAISALYLYIKRPKNWLILLSVGLFFIVVVLQHRSAWTATMAGLSVLLLLERKHLSGMTSLGAGAILVVSGLIAVTLFSTQWGGSAVQGISNSFSSATDLSGGTGYDRLVIWQTMTTRWAESGISTWLFGFPYGIDYVLYILDPRGHLLDVTFSAHNFYVQLLYNTGAAGIAFASGAWVTTVGKLFVRVRQLGTRYQGQGYDSLLLVLVAASLVFFLTYQGSDFHGIILGTAIATTKPSVKRAFFRTVRLAGTRLGQWHRKENLPTISG